MNEKIINLVKETSYFDFEDYQEGIYQFSTRRFGDILNGEYGCIDYQTAIDVRKKLLANFSDINVSIDTCDEWVMLYVTELNK